MNFWKSLDTFEKGFVATALTLFVLALSPSCHIAIESKPTVSAVERADASLVSDIIRVDKLCTELCGSAPDEFGIEPGKEDCLCSDGRTIKIN